MNKIEFMEKYFGIQFLDYQKEIINKLLDEDMLNPKLYILQARRCERTNYKLFDAIRELYELNESSTTQN